MFRIREDGFFQIYVLRSSVSSGKRWSKLAVHMKKTVSVALSSGTLFLLLFALSVGKPGLPVTLKADEPAYYLMALSLVEDGDLECTSEDYRRAFDGYPYLPTENLILMSDADLETIQFGKPFIYSLLAAPLAAFFGANGLVGLNAILFSLMIAMGALYLRRFNTDGQAALFSAAFFFFSPTFHYVFWLQPEILNMTSAMACLFFAFHTFEGLASAGWWQRFRYALFNDRTAPLWSAGCLAFGTYNKPVLALIGVPALLVVFRRRGIRSAVGWLLAAIIVMGAIAGASVLLTGHPSPYLGVLRTGLKIEDPAAMNEAVAEAFRLLSSRSTTANTWSWIFRIPTAEPRELLENAGYFLWGRHTGLLLYFPFAVVCMVLFLAHHRRSSQRWAVFAAIAATALFFLLFIPFNWHGGGGFIGNRYFIMAYPAFLFLVTAVRPLWLLPIGGALAGIFLGTILFTPFGAPVPQPTLQSHVRGGLFRYFPLELSLRVTVPGYNYMTLHQMTLVGRKDVFQTHKPHKPRAWVDGASLEKIDLAGQLDHSAVWIYGASEVDVLVMTESPLRGLFLEVTTWAPHNTVHLEIGGAEQDVVFEEALGRRRTRFVELRPQQHERLHYEKGKRFLVYRLQVEPETGRRVVAHYDPMSIFYLGAQLRIVGRRTVEPLPEQFDVEWQEVESPPSVTAVEEFEIPVQVSNTGTAALSSHDPVAAYLSYHWIDASGARVVRGGKRTHFEPSLPPGAFAQIPMRVIAPTEPGRYRLELDVVREQVAWLSELGGSTYETEIEVRSADSSP
jgi:hypothetical protein